MFGLEPLPMQSWPDRFRPSTRPFQAWDTPTLLAPPWPSPSPPPARTFPASCPRGPRRRPRGAAPALQEAKVWSLGAAPHPGGVAWAPGPPWPGGLRLVPRAAGHSRHQPPGREGLGWQCAGAGREKGGAACKGRGSGEGVIADAGGGGEEVRTARSAEGAWGRGG